MTASQQPAAKFLNQHDAADQLLCEGADMAARQLWLFLTDLDIAQLLARLEAREPGLVASSGRYLRGEAKGLLTAPEALERREAVAGEQRRYLLFHRKHSADTLAHLQPAGPFAGWSQIDEERTDCLVLQTPVSAPGVLAPSRLYAHTSFWRGGEKIRKRPVFAIWANQTLRWLSTQYPGTSIDFMRIGPNALERCKAGSLTLSYLYREIAAEKRANALQIAPPPGTLTQTGDGDDGSDEPDLPATD